jgi:hypothetical protein
MRNQIAAMRTKLKDTAKSNVEMAAYLVTLEKVSSTSALSNQSRSCRIYVAHRVRQRVTCRIDIQRPDGYVSGIVKASRIQGM